MISGWEWIDLDWFRPETLKGFEWVYPEFLWALIFLPLLFFLRWLLFMRIRQKLDVALPERKIKSSFSSLFRVIPSLLFLLFIGFILISLARPQRVNETVEQWSEGIDIALILDVSQSMELQDFKPNRLEAAKRVARNFIQGRFQDRVGIVVFSGDAYSLVPLTTDYELLFESIDQIKLQMIPQQGTAIGSALAVGINRMKESKSASKVAILLSDGDNNAGNIDPITAAELASAYHIKIYSIGVGKEGQVPYGKNFFGGTQYVTSSLDETTLRKISDVTNGQFFRASNNRALEEIFLAIDRLEKAEIKENRYRDTRDYYQVYLYWALVFFFLWLVSKNTFLANSLED
jgi:Ca-activated chloride channel homolog